MPSDPSSFYPRTDPSDPVKVTSASRSAYKALFGNRNFRYWFASSFTSSVGDWMGFVALTALMTQLFDDSSSKLFAVGALLMIRLLPSALFGPIAGVIADRYDRRKVLVFTDMSRATVFFMIAFAGDVLAIFALSFIVECIALLFLAAKDASLPQVVDEEHLTEANQLNLLCSYGTLPLGAVSTSVMIALAAGLGALVPAVGDVNPLRLALVFNAVSFFLSGLLLFKVHLPGETERRQLRAAEEEQPGIIAELREGLDFIRGFPLLRALISGIVGVFFGAGVVIGLGAVFVEDTLGEPAANWSILLSVVGVGLVVGIAVLVPLLRRFTQELVFPIMLALTGLLASITALSVNFEMALGLGALLGASAGVAVVQGYTLLQTYTEDATRARTFSLFYVLTRMSLFAALGIGPFIAGAIGRLVVGTTDGTITISGVRITLIVGGLIALGSGLRARGAIAAARRSADRPVSMHKVGDKPATGLFISFEGVEGAGKSTQIRMLADALVAEGRDVIVTREPGGAPLAERIRQLVLDPATEGMGHRTEALLIAAARADHVEHTIKPALEVGRVVLCDRFIDSSLAYQGVGRGLGVDDVYEVNRWAVNGVMPDVVVLLQLDPREGMQRISRRTPPATDRADQVGGKLVKLPGAGGGPGPDAAADAGKDRMEREDIDFHKRVAKGFLDLARAEHDRFVIVDAKVDVDSIHAQVRTALHRWLPLPFGLTPAAGTSVAGPEGTGTTVAGTTAAQAPDEGLPGAAAPDAPTQRLQRDEDEGAVLDRVSVWDIPAQDRAVEVLSGAVARDDLGHAWAFVGPPDVGQQQAARAFAAAANEVLDDPVQTGRFLRGAHPAYREFAPVGAFHRKDDVHGQWLQAANSTVKEGSVKVLRIVAADRMNDNAANAFLKALEEPPPGTVWILDLSDPEEVPDTILSRCRVVTFAPWTAAQLADLADDLGLTGVDADLAVRVALGSPTALRRLADPANLADYRLHRQWLPRVRAEGPGHALRASSALKAEIGRRVKAIELQGVTAADELTELYGDTPPRAVQKELEERYKRLARAEQTTTVQQALDDVVSWCRDAVVVAGGGGPTAVRNVDALAELQAQAASTSAAALLDICDTALHTREAIEVNVRWDLAIESFILGAHARSLQV